MEVRSKRLPRRHPLLTPIQIPITAASSVEVPTSSSVGHIRSMIRSETGTR